uniref:Ig-like domain-containing protein n=1 Tax=Branchiostoma floridae TaxID=7739 RepID=C3YX35_BRAFL|eukprot:XP_002599041.1 hypothetical protein BRAFLDRAFT_104263 [Branchiostoma floridae]
MGMRLTCVVCEAHQTFLTNCLQTVATLSVPSCRAKPQNIMGNLKLACVPVADRAALMAAFHVLVVAVEVSLSLVLRVFLHSARCCLKTESSVQGAAYRQYPQDTATLLGQPVTLYCSFSGLSPGDVVNWHWYNPSSEAKLFHISAGSLVAPEFPRYSIVGDTERGEYNLYIRDTRQQDEGNYRCSVFSVRDTKDIELKIIVQGAAYRQYPQDTATLLGQPVTLYCSFSGLSPGDVVNWHCIQQSPFHGKPPSTANPLPRQTPLHGKPPSTANPLPRQIPSTANPLPRQTPFHGTANPIPRQTPFHGKPPSTANPLPRQTPFHGKPPSMANLLPWQTPFLSKLPFQLIVANQRSPSTSPQKISKSAAEPIFNPSENTSPLTETTKLLYPPITQRQTWPGPRFATLRGPHRPLAGIDGNSPTIIVRPDCLENYQETQPYPVPPPVSPKITGPLAPRTEGKGLVLTCQSRGGRPLPKLVWYNGTTRQPPVRSVSRVLHNTAELKVKCPPPRYTPSLLGPSPVVRPRLLEFDKFVERLSYRKVRQ